MVDAFTRYSCIPGMLLFGTATVTIQKFVFDVTATGRGGDVHKFKKPWFQTESMFIGMLSCLIVYDFIRMTRKCKAAKKTDAEAQLVNGAEDDSIQHCKHYFYVAGPAMCDLCATSLMNIGLFYLDASIWQMLRGSMVLLSAIMTIIFLHRKYYCYHWFGILLVTCGLVIVAAASLMRNTGDEKKSTTGQIVMAICLVVGAQIIQASQIVIEEYLLKNVKAAASLIVGLEGMWGGLVGALIIWGVHNTGTSSPLVAEVFHEDTIDTFVMIKNSHLLQWLVVFYILCILFYNLFGMMVTQTYSAVYRTIMEAVRTLCIWIVNVIIHYCGLPDFGEPLDKASIVELIGFAILLTGNFTFNKVLRFKCFKYEDAQQ